MHNPLNWFRSEKPKTSPFDGKVLYSALMDNAATIYEEHLEADAGNETATASTVQGMVEAIKKEKGPREIMDLVLKLDQLAEIPGVDSPRGKALIAIANGLRPKM